MESGARARRAAPRLEAGSELMEGAGEVRRGAPRALSLSARMGARSFGSSRTSSSIGGGASASGGGGEKASLEGVASSSDESAPRARALRLRPAFSFMLERSGLSFAIAVPSAGTTSCSGISLRSAASCGLEHGSVGRRGRRWGTLMRRCRRAVCGFGGRFGSHGRWLAAGGTAAWRAPARATLRPRRCPARRQRCPAFQWRRSSYKCS